MPQAPKETAAPATTPVVEAEPETTDTMAKTAENMVEESPKQLQLLGDAIEAKLEVWFPFLAEQPWLQGLAILLIFLILASLASVFLKKFMARLLAKTETDLDDKVLAALTGPIYVTMLSLGFYLGLNRVGIAEGSAKALFSLVMSMIILAWARATMKITKEVLASMGRTGHFGILRTDTMPLFSNLTTIAVSILAVYFLVAAWGQNLSGLMALGGVGGLVIGFAAKDTIGNIFAGIFIFADSPYKVGDYINLDSGERGKVTEIGIRSTRMLTRDDVEITVPNSVIAGAKIINETGGPHIKYRIRIPIGVAYGVDIDAVRNALLEVADQEELAEPDPAPRVRMRGFGNSSLDFELLCWIEEPELRGRAKDALFAGVYKRFAELDIEIPFVKRDIYIKEMPEQGNSSQNSTQTSGTDA